MKPRHCAVLYGFCYPKIECHQKGDVSVCSMLGALMENIFGSKEPSCYNAFSCEVSAAKEAQSNMFFFRNRNRHYHQKEHQSIFKDGQKGECEMWSHAPSSPFGGRATEGTRKAGVMLVLCRGCYARVPIDEGGEGPQCLSPLKPGSLACQNSAGQNNTTFPRSVPGAISPRMAYWSDFARFRLPLTR